MGMSITAAPREITAAINAFNSGYHADYFAVRCLARKYLANPPSSLTTMPLASALNAVLARWGAGKRGAPACQASENTAAALSDIALHSCLVSLERCVPYLKIINGRRYLAAGAPLQTVAEFDNCLIGTLSSLSTQLFEKNTNVTYPMKSLLLLTGLIPAFDSQVKGGLANAGVSGVKKTRYLLPSMGDVDAKKICCLPFYIADCMSSYSALLASGIANCKYPTLSAEQGRIFDVLLFMQNNGAHITVGFHSPKKDRWYEI